MSLIHWWPLIGDKLDKITGLELDSTSSTFVSGKIGKALQLNSTIAKTTNPFIGLNDWSISFWVMDNGSSAWSDFICFSKNLVRIELDNASNWRWYVGEAGTGITYPTTGDLFVSGTIINSGVTANTWYHVAIAKSGVNAQLYINGTLKTSTTSAINFTAESAMMYFNSRATETTSSKMSLNDVRCYDHALSYAEVKELSKALVMHYTFNDRPQDYLEFTGNHYINTGVTVDAKWEFDMQWTLTGSRQLMGYQGSSAQYWGVNADGYYEIYNSSGVKAGGRDFITHYFNEDGKCQLVIEGKGSIGAGGPIDGHAYQIGAVSGGALCSFKLYRCRCISQGVLIRDFIPYSQNGTLGLMDLVNNQFYTNARGAAFTGSVSQGNTIVDDSGHGYNLTCKGPALIHDSPCGTSSLSCTGGRTGYSSANGVSWSDTVYARHTLDTAITTDEFTVVWWGQLKKWSLDTDINISRGSLFNLADSEKGGLTGTLLCIDSYFYAGNYPAQGAPSHGIPADKIVIADSKWHHCAITAKIGGDVVGYCDGKIVYGPTTCAVSSFTPFNNLILGTSNAGGVVRSSQANFADFRVYTKQLAEEDIKDLYATKAYVTNKGGIETYQFIENKSQAQVTNKGTFECSEIVESLSNYIPLEYIEFSTASPGIDSGISLGTALVFEITTSHLGGSNPYILTQGNYGLRIYNSSFTNFVTNRRFRVTSLDVTAKHTIQGSDSSLIVDGEVGFQETDNDTPSGNVKLFTNRDNIVTKGRLYQCILKNQNTIVRYFRPVQRKADNAIGLLDNITNQFYTCAGITAGPVQVEGAAIYKDGHLGSVEFIEI